jgi:hypothetical protein
MCLETRPTAKSSARNLRALLEIQPNSLNSCTVFITKSVLGGSKLMLGIAIRVTLTMRWVSEVGTPRNHGDLLSHCN